MKPGTLCSVRRGAPLYPKFWKKGQQPINIDATTTGIFLDSKQEPDTFEPRTFLRVYTHYGVGWVNSTFCREEI